MDNTNIIQYNPFSNENKYLKLANAEISHLVVENTSFSSCLFLLGSWKKIKFVNCTFHSCIFDSLDLTSCKFENCTFVYTRFDSCKWTNCVFEYSTWKKCNVVYNQWILCQIDLATSEFIDGYSNQEDEIQNTATWTFSKKLSFC